MKTLIVAFSIFVAGCGASLHTLIKPQHEQYFVLSQDHVRVQSRGLLNIKWVEGLRTCRYTAIGEDEKGTYFLGDGACLILSREGADEYLRTGVVPSPAKNQTGTTAGVGGLWIPKAGTSEEPRLFYELRAPSDRGASLGGPVDIAIEFIPRIAFNLTNAIIDGKLEFIPYGSENEFIRGLVIVGK